LYRPTRKRHLVGRRRVQPPPGTIYGMNFDHMPELNWQFGYPLALLAMVGTGLILYIVFKRRHWL